jgi:hypothetical protein
MEWVSASRHGVAGSAVSASWRRYAAFVRVLYYLCLRTFLDISLPKSGFEHVPGILDRQPEAEFFDTRTIFGNFDGCQGDFVNILIAGTTISICDLVSVLESVASQKELSLYREVLLQRAKISE